MKSIAITGSKGLIGNKFYCQYKKKYKITKYIYDINNYKKINEFIRKNNFSYFLHFASFSRSNCIINKKKCYITNYLSTKNIVNKLKYKNTKLIFLSSSHIYKKTNKKIKESFSKKPINYYGKLKLKSENYIIKNLKNYLIIRLFNVYGKKQSRGYFIPDIISKIKKKKLIKIDNSKRDFIDVNEVSRFLNFTISKNIQGIFNFGSGKSHDLVKIINMISLKLKTKPIIKKTKIKHMIVSDNYLIKKTGFKFKNEKNINF